MRVHHDVEASDAASLSALGLRDCGRNIRIKARALALGEGVTIGDGVILAGDDVELGHGVVIKEGADLRSRELRIGPRSIIGARTEVLVADSFAVGMATRISHLVEITCRSFSAGDLLFFGDRLVVGGGGHFESTAHVKIGSRVALGSRCMLNANRPLQLDDQVGSGDYLSLWTHGFHFGHSVLDGFGAIYEPIHIERNVWLAHHVTILPGVRIGENTIVAACSVVTKSLPADSLAAGVPATVKKTIKFQPLETEDALEAVKEILRRWAGEMEWKGWLVEGVLSARCDEPLRLCSAQGERCVQLYLSGRQDDDLPELKGRFGIIVSLDEHPSWAERLPEGWTLLELRSRAFRGASFDVSEDLRDFLRRNSISCGSETLFESIQPTPFQRLRDLI